nr:3054_t:CDS:2 [Entrophospora candida]
MSKARCIPVTLLNNSALVSELRYGPFSSWWQSSDNEKDELIDSFEDTSPIEVWKKTNYFQKYDGYQFFGLDNIIVQDFIKKHKVPKCTPDEWNNFSLKESTIIELSSQLEIIYQKNYEMKERELGVWQAMLRASGCHNIIPWTRDESKTNGQISL